MQARVEKYGSRAWCVLVDDKLLCVTVYRKGAEAVAHLLRQVSLN